MKTHGGQSPAHSFTRDLRSNAEAASLDADAKLAFLSFCEQIALICQSAPEDIRAGGVSAVRSYLGALRADRRFDPTESGWRDFIRSVWTLLNALDRYPSRASSRWRDARGSLIRIVVDNADLLDTRQDLGYDQSVKKPAADIVSASSAS